MNTPKWQGVLRHILTLGGGILVAIGVITDDVFSQGVEIVMTAAGAISALWGFITSLTAPEKKITNAEYQALKNS